MVLWLWLVSQRWQMIVWCVWYFVSECNLFIYKRSFHRSCWQFQCFLLFATLQKMANFCFNCVYTKSPTTRRAIYNFIDSSMSQACFFFVSNLMSPQSQLISAKSVSVWRLLPKREIRFPKFVKYFCYQHKEITEIFVTNMCL